MKNLKLAAIALATVTAGQALALTPGNATAWGGPGCNNAQSSDAGFKYCWTNYTSGTTAAQLGTVTVSPAKHIYLAVGVSGTALSGLVTPTVSLKLGTRTISTLSVSATTAGNVVDLGNVPYFNAIGVSTTNPATISSTNSLLFSIIENDK